MVGEHFYQPLRKYGGPAEAADSEKLCSQFWGALFYILSLVYSGSNPIQSIVKNSWAQTFEELGDCTMIYEKLRECMHFK